MAVAATIWIYGGVDMDGKQRWLGWIGIGLGALALAVALFGGSFGPQLGAAGGPNMNMQPQSAQQQNTGPQAGPGQQNAGRQNAGPQAGFGGDARRGGGRPGDGGFGMAGWLRFPFRLIGGTFQWAM